MRALALPLLCVVSAAALLLASPAKTVELRFVAASAAQQWDAQAYRAIWEESGERIVTAFEAATCLPFTESIVSAIVAEDVSHSGGPEHPMQLRASYTRGVKQATLVHELGHRHLWQLAERLEGIDGHMTLYLVLHRVWAKVWGEKFAEQRARGEAEWRGGYDYAAAWKWARSLSRKERTRLWNRLLALNGFPEDCNG